MEFIIFSCPVSRSILQQTDQRFASGESSVERVGRFQGGLGVCGLWRNSVVYARRNFFPDFTNIRRRQRLDLSQNMFNGCGHKEKLI